MNKTTVTRLSRSGFLSSLSLALSLVIPAGQAQEAVDLGDLTLVQIYNSAELKDLAVAGGEAAFAEHCVACHGEDGSGKTGIPDLVDYDWLWGSALSDIETSIRYGIRSGHDLQRYSEMPAYEDTGLLTNTEIDDQVEYLLALSGGEADAAAVARAEGNFEAICSECHDLDGKGLIEWYGAPNLTDDYWLYGGSREEIRASIANGLLGASPAWDDVLDNNTIKMLAIYVYYLTHY